MDTIYNPPMRKMWNPAISANGANDEYIHPPLVSESRKQFAEELRRMARERTETAQAYGLDT